MKHQNLLKIIRINRLKLEIAIQEEASQANHVNVKQKKKKN